MSFTAVVIVLLFDREIFGPKILMIETTISFLSECLADWRLSRSQFKPVWAETIKNYPARKLELPSPQNRYKGHQCDIWKIMGKAIFFVKGLYWLKFLLKRYRTLKLGKNGRLSNTCHLLSFLAKPNYVKASFTTTLYLLDLIWFGPTFGLFHYANFPSYKRVRWGPLAGNL